MAFRGQIKNKDEATALDMLRNALASGRSTYSVIKELKVMGIKVHSTKLYRWAKNLKGDVPPDPSTIDPARELRELYIHIKLLREGSQDNAEKSRFNKEMSQILQKLQEKGAYSKADLDERIRQQVALYSEVVSRFLEQKLTPIIGEKGVDELLQKLSAAVQANVISS